MARQEEVWMKLRAILQQKPELFDRLSGRWRQLTGGQLLAVDCAGEWVACSRPFAGLNNGVLPENWQDWLTQGEGDQARIVVEGQPVQIAPLTIQDTPAGYLVAVGEASSDLFQWAPRSWSR